MFKILLDGQLNVNFRRSVLKIKPKDYRPDAVIFRINQSALKCILQKPPQMPTQSKNYIDFSNCKRLFAVDYSGSVKNCPFYHRNLRKIFDELYKPGDTIMTWSDGAEIVSYNKIKEIYIQELGTNNTCPSSILHLLYQNHSIPREHLILVTYGRIDSEEVNDCDEFVTKNHIVFKYVTTYVIGDGGDLSVGTSFALNCGSITYEVKESGTSAEFNLLI